MSPDTRRLNRALRLRCRRLSRTEFRVAGGARQHLVRWEGRAWVCDCEDFNYRRIDCKHTIRARLAVGDPRLIAELGRMFETEVQV